MQDTVIRLGIKLGQHLDTPIIGPALSWLNGCDIPTYVKAPYFEIEGVTGLDGREADLPIADEDPNARWIAEYIQRYKRNAVIVAAGVTAVREVMETAGRDLAGVVSLSGIIVAAKMPYSYQDLGMEPRLKGAPPPEVEPTHTVALREGRESFPVGWGVLAKNKDVVVIPEDLHIEASHVPVKSLSAYSYVSPRLF